MTDKQKQFHRPDFCVIGAGSGGLSFAAGAVQMGASVILLEHQKMGGDCLNTGCIPSKALLAAAKIGHVIQDSERFGWSVQPPTVDYKQVYKYIHGVIAVIAPTDSVQRFEGLGVTVIREEGAFVDETIVETQNHRIQAKRFIVATGSTPFVPPIEGLSKIPYLTNESIFDLEELPEHLVVIGGGPIGIEMAQAFRRLGSKVTVLEAFSVLPKDEPEIVFQLKKILTLEGIDIKEHMQISSLTQIECSTKIIYVDVQGRSEELTASHVLVATGRRPTIQNLNLSAAKIAFTPKGITVDDSLKTSNRRVFALGDCVGGYQFTHVAGYHAGLAIRNSIFRLGTKIKTRAIPWVTYTDPELAHVGALESQLESENIKYKVLHLPFKDNDRAQAEGKTTGEIRVLVSLKGKILGATILGSQAGELIYPWVIAIQNNLKLTEITNSIAPYPTLNDLSKRVAGSFYTDKIFSPFMKCIVRFIMGITR